MIPRGGYRADDMLDDVRLRWRRCGGTGAAKIPPRRRAIAAIVHGRRPAAEEMRADLAYGARAANPSAEAWMLERGANPPDEVREPAAIYRISQHRRIELFRA